MRVLFLGINYWPEATGISVFSTGKCEYLASRGHQVTVCTSFPYYPEWRTAAAYRGRLYAKEHRNGVEVLRSWTYVPGRVTPLRRVLHEASFVVSSCLRAMSATPPDLLFVVSPPLGLGLSAGLLARHWGIPYVFHVTDLQPDAAFDLGMLKGGAVAKVLYAVEDLAYRRAALVSTLTAGMRDRILEKGVPPEKVRLFPLWADPELFDVPLEGGGERFRSAFDLGGRFLVVHAGNMGVKQGLEVVVETARLLRDDPDVMFLLVGDGAARESLEKRTRDHELGNVRFLPLQPKAMFLELLAASDLCLLTQQKSVAEIVFPSKVVTMLAAGCPVVASVSPTSEVGRVLEEGGGGVVVPPEDPVVLARAITELRRDPQRMRAMGVAGRRYARTAWERGRILAGVATSLEPLLRGGSSIAASLERA